MAVLGISQSLRRQLPSWSRTARRPSFPITITPTNGFTAQVTFSASNPIPVGACVFYPQPNPANVTSAQTFNFLFTTNDPATRNSCAYNFSHLHRTTDWGGAPFKCCWQCASWRSSPCLPLANFIRKNFFWTRAAVVVPALVLTFAALTFVGCGWRWQPQRVGS